MTYGLQIVNPSGELVISSDGVGYKYLGVATLSVSASSTLDYYSGGSGAPPGGEPYGQVTPYTYMITVPEGTVYPVVGVKVTTTTLVEVVETWQVMTTLFIRVNSVNISGADDITTVSFSAPTIYVFCQHSAADSNHMYGMNLYNASGVLTFSSNVCPLFVNQHIDFSESDSSSSYVTGYTRTWGPGTYGDGATLVSAGQSRTWAGISTGIILGGSGGGEVNAASSESEDLYTKRFGWTYSGNTLIRKPYISIKVYRTMIYTDPNVTEGAGVGKQKVLIVDSNNLF